MMNEKKHTLGLSLFRVIVGFLVTFYFIAQWKNRELFWGPHGIFPIELWKNQSMYYTTNLYSISDSILYFNTLYIITILVSVLFMIGFRSRVMGVLLWILFYSFTSRTPYTINSGDVFLSIFLFYLILCDTSKHFSIDAWGKRKREKIDSTFDITVHNFGLYLFIAQVVILYLFSALFKSFDNAWWNGEALYIVNQIQWFVMHPNLSTWMNEHVWIYKTGSYFSFFLQMLFPLLLFLKKYKKIVVFLMMFHHFMIAGMTGLFYFSLYMIAAEFILLSNTEYKEIKRYFIKNKVSV